MKGRIHSVETFGALDGPGIRYVVFMQGCLLKCRYCHNPDTWDACDGKEMQANELIKQMDRYKSFISHGGVTFSGGEPLLQHEFLEEVITSLKKSGMHTAIDTSGAVPLKQSHRAISLADLILLDIKAIDPELCKDITGMDNANALETLEFCDEQNKPVWIRYVMVPGLTLEEEQLEKTAKYLRGYSCIERVELLPFHKMGEYKWEQLNREYTLKDTPVPTPEQIAKAVEIFRKYKLPVKD
ncbi:MAG: pyruvate formate lyase-activating protein [Clostridia bacterium]|nr:pyruvate formate lyase-activating protein [Clostridia bacterium]